MAGGGPQAAAPTWDGLFGHTSHDINRNNVSLGDYQDVWVDDIGRAWCASINDGVSGGGDVFLTVLQ